MISIPGIKYQKELELLPYFNKATAGTLLEKEGRNLDKKIALLTKKGYIIPLKKGIYATSAFVEKNDKRLYLEYVANILRYPSYLSLEYALSLYGLIPEGVYTLTSITVKSGRTFKNALGAFIYKSIAPGLFPGFGEKEFLDKKIKIAGKAKALFDFLYLKKLINPKNEIAFDLRINWDNFTNEDLIEFEGHVGRSGIIKMEKLLKVIKNLYVFR